MNKEMKQYLETVVTSVVNEDSAAAKAAFHEYLRLKTQDILGEAKDEEKDEEEGSGDEGSSEDESSEEGSGEDESSEEDKKANPFAKKSDK
jgi:hypothetical protein